MIVHLEKLIETINNSKLQVNYLPDMRVNEMTNYIQELVFLSTDYYKLQGSQKSQRFHQLILTTLGICKPYWHPYYTTILLLLEMFINNTLCRIILLQDSPKV